MNLNDDVWGIINVLLLLGAVFVAAVVDSWFVLKICNKCHQWTKAKQSITIPQSFLRATDLGSINLTIDTQQDGKNIDQTNNTNNISTLSKKQQQKQKRHTRGPNKTNTNAPTILCIQMRDKLERINLNKAIKYQRICVLIRIKKTVKEKNNHNNNNNNNKNNKNKNNKNKNNNINQDNTTTGFHRYQQYQNYLIPINRQTNWSNNFLFYPQFQDLYYLLPQHRHKHKNKHKEVQLQPTSPRSQSQSDTRSQTLSSGMNKKKHGHGGRQGAHSKIVLINLQKAYRLGFIFSPNLILYENLIKLNVNLAAVDDPIAKSLLFETQQQRQQLQLEQETNVTSNTNSYTYDSANGNILHGNGNGSITSMRSVALNLALDDIPEDMEDDVEDLVIKEMKEMDSILHNTNIYSGSQPPKTVTLSNQTKQCTHITEPEPHEATTNTDSPVDLKVGTAGSICLTSITPTTTTTTTGHTTVKGSYRGAHSKLSNVSSKDQTVDAAFLRQNGTIVKIHKSKILDEGIIVNKKDFLPCCCLTGGFDYDCKCCKFCQWCSCDCDYNYDYHQRLAVRKYGCGCVGIILFSLAIVFVLMDGIVHGLIVRNWTDVTSIYENIASICNYIAVFALFYLIVSSSVLVLQNTSYAYSNKLITVLNYIYLSQLLQFVVPLSRLISIENTMIYVLIVTIGYGYFLCYFCLIFILFKRKTNQILKDLNSCVCDLSTKIGNQYDNGNINNSDNNCNMNNWKKLQQDMLNIDMLLFPTTVKSYSLTQLGCAFAVLAHKTVKFYVVTGLFFVATIVAMIFRVMDRVLLHDAGYLDTFMFGMVNLFGLLMSLLYLDSNVVLYVQCCMPCHRCCLKRWLKRQLKKPSSTKSNKERNFK